MTDKTRTPAEWAAAARSALHAKDPAAVLRAAMAQAWEEATSSACGQARHPWASERIRAVPNPYRRPYSEAHPDAIICTARNR